MCTDTLFLTSWNKTGEVGLSVVQQYPQSSNYNAKSAQTLKGLLTAIKKDPSECRNLLIAIAEYSIVRIGGLAWSMKSYDQSSLGSLLKGYLTTRQLNNVPGLPKL